MSDSIEVSGDEEERLDADVSGIFTWDLDSGIVHADTAVAKLFGLNASRTLAGLPIDHFLARILESDRPKVASSIHEAILTGHPYHEVYSVIGRVETAEVVAFGRCFRNAEGEPRLYAGIVFKVEETLADGDPMIAPIARAHKIAASNGRSEVADALEVILEDLSRTGSPPDGTKH